jgi:hypothetical protein
LSTSQLFLALLMQRRNELYARALAGGASPEQGEAALAAAFRRAMIESHGPNAPSGGGGAAALLEAQLPRQAGVAADNAGVMPADVFARLSAVIAAAGETGGISGPERAALKDPLLAPKRHKRPKEPMDGLGFSPLMRFIVAAMIALAAGAAATAVMMGWW